MSTRIRALSVAVATLAIMGAGAQAQSGQAAVAGGVHIGHHHGSHHHWHYGVWGFGWYPGVVFVEPRPWVYERVPIAEVAPAVASPPDPVFTPRNAQDAAQTESDRQACNRWTMTQPSAMTDARAFHRMTLGCMEGRGYSVR